MNNLIWIVDFRKTTDFNSNDQEFFLSKQFCRYDHISSILNNDESEASIKKYFDEFQFKLSFNEILSGNKIFSSIKVFIIANSEDKIYLASLFSYYIKLNELAIKNHLAVLPKNSLNCYLLSYWENAWDFNNIENNANALYELNLFQCIPDIKVRPFDFVFFYKDFNGGIQQLGYKYNSISDEKKNYHHSKILSLIWSLSITDNGNIMTYIQANPERWSLSFGSHLFYIDNNELYSKTSNEILNKLTDVLFTSSLNPWDINFETPISDKIECLKYQEIYETICLNELDNNDFSFYKLNSYKFWNWFSISKINSFFEDLGGLLFEIKLNRKDFLDKNYKNIKENINLNFENLIDFNNITIKAPIDLFDEYYSKKKFSLESLRKEIIVLADNINTFKTTVVDDKRFFHLNQESEEFYSDLQNTLGEKNDIYLTEFVDNHLLKIKNESENISHPYSLVFKSIILGTILSLILYIPINNLITNNPYILSFISSLVFLLPILLNWSKIDEKIKKINSLKNEFQTLNKYVLDRKLNNLAKIKVDLFYENYLKKCDDIVSSIILKFKDFKTYNEEKNKKNDDTTNLIDEYSITNSVKSVNEIPNVKVRVNSNIIDYKTLLSENEDLYIFHNKIFDSLEIKLSNFLNKNNNCLESINNAIIKELIETPGNVSSVSDLFFYNNLNFTTNKKKDFLNLLPPFNNSDENRDCLTLQILSNELHTNIDFNTLLLDTNFKSSLHHYINEQKELSVLIINQPYNKLFGLFSSSLEGNSFNYFDAFKTYSSKNKDRIELLTGYVIKEIVNHFNIVDSSNDKFKFVLSYIKGYDLDYTIAKDLKFDVDDFDNLDETSKIYLEFCKNRFRECVRENIINNQNS